MNEQNQKEYEKMILRVESDLDRAIQKIHNIIYEHKTTMNTEDKIYLLCGLIIARLNDDDYLMDSDKIVNRINSFLDGVNFPNDVRNLFLNKLSNVFSDNVGLLETLYECVKTELMPCFNTSVPIDFMGRIFNRLADWTSIENDVENDVVLTPRYVARFMAKLCRVDKDSFVWDRTMGSASFLIAAMELMIQDAQEKISENMILTNKISQIKSQQLFGIELLPEIFILAFLNMILNNNTTTNISIGDAHNKNIGSQFPANVFLLNPPYSADGKGFIFVEEALSMMNSGYAAVLIQESAGSGQGLPYTKEILKRNTLLASIHMNSKLFAGKAGVQTAIYVFEVNKKHDPNSLVKFIDFSNDGYFRQSRKKSNQSVNLQNIDDAIGRYAEVEALVLGQTPNTTYYTKENGFYIEDTITLEGNDWTYAQHKKINIEADVDDFRQTVQDFLSWKINKVIHDENNSAAMNKLTQIYREFRLDEIFEKIKTKPLPYKVSELPSKKYGKYNLPALTAGIENQGLSCYVPREGATVLKNCISVSANGANTGAMFYQPDEFTVLQDSYALKYKGDEEIAEMEYLYFIAVMQKQIRGHYDWSNKAGWEKIRGIKVRIPVSITGSLDFEYMRKFMELFRQESIQKICSFL